MVSSSFSRTSAWILLYTLSHTCTYTPPPPTHTHVLQTHTDAYINKHRHMDTETETHTPHRHTDLTDTRTTHTPGHPERETCPRLPKFLKKSVSLYICCIHSVYGVLSTLLHTVRHYCIQPVHGLTSFSSTNYYITAYSETLLHSVSTWTDIV
jgi:hypothetical protein